MRRRWLLVTGMCVLTLLCVAAPAAAATYDEAVDELVQAGWPETIVEDLCALGTDPDLGFRLSGSSAEHAASEYVAGLLEDMGLSDVAMEAVPVDAWEFLGASVTVGGRELEASSFAGVPGTDEGGITSEVVYVGEGTALDYAALPEDVDVGGKLVLVDSALDWWWINMVGAEATHQGAAGVIMTYGDKSYPWYAYPDALGGNDGEYDTSFVPVVYISWEDGDWLKEQLEAGPVSATMVSEVEMTMSEEGGEGYNVLGVLEGTEPEAEPLLVVSHLDAHFRAGLDDTGAVANELLVAKAMVNSGYTPVRDIIFLFTSSEEYGYTNCWFDWAIGAWYAITQEHTDWPGKVVAMLNLEGMAEPGAKLHLRAAPDLLTWAEAVAKDSKALLPNGVSSAPAPSTWTDAWTFNAAGVPTLTLSALTDEYDLMYHTNLETEELVDYGYLGDIAKYNGRLLADLDEGLLPYDFRGRADQLAQTITPGKLQRAGADRAAIDGLQKAVTGFRTAAQAWELRKDRIGPADLAAVNTNLVQIEKLVAQAFTSRDAWDYTAYPHEQVVWDLLALDQALDALDQGRPNADRAQTAISNVGINWNGLYFSYEVYAYDLARHDPGYYRSTWGAQGHPPVLKDLMPAYFAVGEGDYEGAEQDLRAARDDLADDLDTRLAALTQSLEEITAGLQALP